MTLRKTAVGTAVLACGLAGAAVAFGAGSTTKAASTTTTSTTAPSARAGRTSETAIIGDVATQAKAAAVAKVGGTADGVTTENDNSNPAAKYEVHVTNADGTHAKVILDSSFAVLSVETGGPGGGDHGRGGGSGETPLTGDLATRANAAAVAKVGGTADGATTENDSSNAAAKYEVHVTKTDGTHVKVILDSSLAVLSVETQPGPGGPGPGDGSRPHDGSRHDGFRFNGFRNHP
jgi:uncharacterized membrane protein YkoI